jgi:hypothetical protein
LEKSGGNFSLGLNGGYMFGKKQSNTRLAIINTDTAYSPFYYKSNSSTSTFLGKFFVQAGTQFETTLRKTENKVTKTTSELKLTLGATALFKQTFNSSQDLVRETFEYNNAGGTVTMDSVYTTSVDGIKMVIPATYTFGAMLHEAKTQSGFTTDRWTLGAEFELSKWSQYRFNGAADRLTDNWQFRMGGQILPSLNKIDLLGRSTYRFGFSFGKDYINADGNGLKTYSGTLGLGIPIKRWSFYSNQFTTINVAAEYGKRGSKVNNVTENFFRLSVGFSLSDVWFVKRKYD